MKTLIISLALCLLAIVFFNQMSKRLFAPDSANRTAVGNNPFEPKADDPDVVLAYRKLEHKAYGDGSSIMAEMQNEVEQHSCILKAQSEMRRIPFMLHIRRSPGDGKFVEITISVKSSVCGFI